MATAKERIDFTLAIAREFPHKSAAEVQAFCNSLLRHARTHGLLAVEECNGPDYYQRERKQEPDWYATWLNQLEIRQARTEKRIRELCADFGVAVELGGDPRGYTVKLTLPSGRGNTWGGSESGWGVPQ